MVFVNIKKILYFKVNFEQEKDRELEVSITQVKSFIKDNGKTITSMEQVAIHSKMVASMMASGSMDKSTAKDYMLIRMAIHMKANFPEV